MIDAIRKSLSSWSAAARAARLRAAGVCECCGTLPSQRLDVHHIVPVNVGGTNDAWNLMALCRACHSHAEWLIRRFVEPVLIAAPIPRTPARDVPGSAHPARA